MYLNLHGKTTNQIFQSCSLIIEIFAVRLCQISLKKAMIMYQQVKIILIKAVIKLKLKISFVK